MGAFLELVELDRVFMQMKSESVVIINDFEPTDEAEKAKLNKLIYTTYEGDVMAALPSCECGHLKGAYHKRTDGTPVICTRCHTELESPIDQDLDPLVWMRAPNGVEKIMSPIVWLMLSHNFDTKGFNVMEWIVNTRYAKRTKSEGMLKELEIRFADKGITRGYNSLVRNFDAVCDILFSLKSRRTTKRVQDTNMAAFVKKFRKQIFSEYLPLPNRTLIVIEKTNVGVYRDPIITEAIDGIRIMIGIDGILSNDSVRSKEGRLVKSLVMLSKYYENFYNETFSRKTGIARKHMYGSRLDFSARTVITSLTGEHVYDEIHIPWGVGVSYFRLHLMNKLYARGYSTNSARKLINESAVTYHPLIDELFKELIAESPYIGISVTLQRNPSLEAASAQTVYITKVKTDPSINSTSISILSVKGLNADQQYLFDTTVLSKDSIWKLSVLKYLKIIRDFIMFRM